MDDSARLSFLQTHPRSVRFDPALEKWVATAPGLRTGPGKYDFDLDAPAPTKAFDQLAAAIDYASSPSRDQGIT